MTKRKRGHSRPAKPSKNHKKPSKRRKNRKTKVSKNGAKSKQKVKSSGIIRMRSTGGQFRGSSGRFHKRHWKSMMRMRRLKKREYVQEYLKQDWYWGMISQSEAEEFLKDARNGEFLVRGMLLDDVVDVLITHVSITDREKKFNHWKANIVSGYWQLENFKKTFDTVLDLVAYYHVHPIDLTGYKLKIVAKQPDWFIRSHRVLASLHGAKLGAGNFSFVTLGAFRRRMVAVKRLTSSGEQLLKDREDMMKEAAVMNKLQHPYITKMIGVCMDRLPPMLLIEIMATSLLEHVQEHGPETHHAEKLLYCWQLAAGMAHMAKLGIIHRDLACRNAMFNKNGILKIADFGLADHVSKFSLMNTLNQQMPYPWMAPEAICIVDRPCIFNEKTDVWSFGVTCIEIYENGKPPLEDLVVKDVRIAIIAYDDAKPLHSFKVEKVERMKNEEKKDFEFRKSLVVDADVRSHLLKCVKANPADRPNFAEIEHTLDLLLKLKHAPPDLEKRTICRINGVRPLTNAEYEILYHNNMDWHPAVRKVRRRKNDVERRKEGNSKTKSESKKNKKKKKKTYKSSKSKKSKKEDKKKELRELRKKLRRKRKRQRIRIKLRWWRMKRRNEKRRMQLLMDYEYQCPKKKTVRTNGQKRIRPVFKKLVSHYWKLSATRWRKQKPCRKTHLRLRRHRLINKMSKHPASRNGKSVRVLVASRQNKRVKATFTKPVLPKFPKFQNPTMKKKNKKEKQEKTSAAKIPSKRRKVKIGVLPGDVIQQALYDRRMRKKRRRLIRKRIKRIHRKKYRMKKRQRRRQKRRRLYRKKKEEAERRAMNLAARERMRILKRRRLEKKRKLIRLKRQKKIGKALREWRALRILLKLKAQRKAMKKGIRKLNKARKEKITAEKKRSGRKKQKKVRH